MDRSIRFGTIIRTQDCSGASKCFGSGSSTRTLIPFGRVLSIIPTIGDGRAPVFFTNDRWRMNLCGSIWIKFSGEARKGGIASFSFWGRQTARQASPRCVRGKPPIQNRGHSWHCGRCRGPTVREGGRAHANSKILASLPPLLARGFLQRPVCLCRRY